MLLSGDISLNPGLNRTNRQLTENLKVFKNRGLLFIHLNINNILSKTDELREIVIVSNAIVAGITELKLDDSICIEGYNIIRCDQNSKSGSAVCYVCIKICFNAKNCISNEIENFFIELRIPKTKPITVGIKY